MSPQPDENRSPEEVEQTVADYLQAHPDFFERHPNLLSSIELSHQSDGTPSLIERQVKTLREEEARHKQQLEELMEVARENEEINQRLHQLTLTLIDTIDFDEAINALQDKLYDDFKAEGVEFHLFSHYDEESNPDLDGFKEFLEQGKPWCGQLGAEKRTYLFGPQAEDIQSTAMIPIEGEGVLGVLAIGSSDINRFHPDKGTEYLNRLGDIISKTLEVVSEPGF
jgi:uncharacterized protein YigA (DUF484 family)